MVSDIRSKQIRVGGLDIRYFLGGTGEPLVVVHGSGAGGVEWTKSMSGLCQHYTVYVPDLPGFGGSQQIDGDYTVADFVEFMEDFTRSLGLKRFHLVGHSIGGGIALRYAVKFPHKIGKLVLVNSMGVGRGVAFWLRLLSSSTLCHSLGVALSTLLRGVEWLFDALYAPLKFANPLPLAAVILGAAMALFREEAVELVPRLAALMIPTLLVWGARDKVIPVSNAYDAARLIPGCQLYVFEGGGHSVYREKTEEFTRLLTGFLC